MKNRCIDIISSLLDVLQNDASHIRKMACNIIWRNHGINDIRKIHMKQS